MSRRNFLKGLGLFAAAHVVAASAPLPSHICEQLTTESAFPEVKPKNRFDVQAAAKHAEMYIPTYYNQKNFTEWATKEGYMDIFVADQYPKQGKVVYDPTNEKIIIAFAGTFPTGWHDFKSDVDIRFTDSPLGGQIDEGFYKALHTKDGDHNRDLWATIQKHVDGLLDKYGKDTAVEVSGHSHGSGLATVAAATLAASDQNYNIAGVYLAGAPKVHDCVGASNYDAALGDVTYRIVLGADIVSQLPPLSYASPHEHVGQRYQLSHHGTLT